VVKYLRHAWYIGTIIMIYWYQLSAKIECLCMHTCPVILKWHAFYVITCLMPLFFKYPNHFIILLMVSLANFKMNIFILYIILFNTTGLLNAWMNLIGWQTFKGVWLFSEKHTAKVFPARSWPHYSSISLCQIITNISLPYSLQQQIKPKRHWPSK